MFDSKHPEPFGSARQTAMAMLHRMLWSRYGVTSYAQHGEDIVLAHYLDRPSQRRGFYVDVGAHHPRRMSVTHLYSHHWGWRGINIDPNAELMSLFKKARRRDINLNCAVSATEGTATYYAFSEPAVNTLSPTQAESLQAGGTFKLIKTAVVPMQPLASILGQHLPEGQAIDFLNVDAEQFDLEVLRSNDWARYRPTVVLVEDLEVKLTALQRSPIVRFMAEQEFEPIGLTCKTIFFKDARGGVHIG